MVTYSTDRFRHPRGSVMILVVAVLGLLAVLGTVYIVASRTQRASSAAMNADYNFNLARQGVLATVQQVIGESMLDGNGAIGATGDAAITAARTFDYPERNIAPAGVTAYNAKLRDEPWLVAHMHYQDSASFPANKAPNDLTLLTPNLFNPSMGQFDIPPTTTTMFPYDNTVGVRGLSTVVGDQTTFGAGNTDTTADDPPTALSDAYIQLLPFSDISGVRYRYGVRIIDTNRMANLNTGANDDAAALADASGSYLTSVRLAPKSDLANMDYNFNNYFSYGTGNNGDGVTVGTTDMKTALQSSQVAATSGLGRAGFSSANAIFSLSGWQQQILHIENPSDPLLTLFQPTDELELRSYGEYGTSNPLRAAAFNSAASPNFRVWPYTLAVMYNTNSPPGFSPGGSVVGGNPRRRSYTFYSFSRAFRPYVDPKTLTTPIPDYTLLLTSSPTVNANALLTPSTTDYPLDGNNDTEIFPKIRLQQIHVNYPASFSTTAANDVPSNDAMFYLAMTASNLATLMESGVAPAPVAIVTPTADPAHPNVFSHDETVQYAANYVASRTNAMILDPALIDPTLPVGDPKQTNAYYLPAGPSFIDNTGICVRAGVSTGDPRSPTIYLHERDFGKSTNTTLPTLDTSQVTGGSGINLIALGYAAQPYINEVAVYLDTEDDPVVANKKNPVVKDFAIELYNPYDAALSLKGYHIKTATAEDLDLSAYYIPAGKFLVILTSTGSGHFAADPYLTQTSPKSLYDPKDVPTTGTYVLVTTDKLTISPTGGAITLYRPYFKRGNSGPTPDLAPVDQQTYAAAPDQLLDTANITEGTPKEFSLQRGNAPGSGGKYWGSAITASTRADGQTLGNVNASTPGSGLPLYDRYTASTGLTNGAAFTNINQFNQIMRVSHLFDGTDSANPAPVMLLSAKLPTLSATTAFYDKMQFPVDAQLHFDFYAAPYVYDTTPSSNPVTPPSTIPASGDIRAIHLLEQISFIDRVTDRNYQIPGANNIDKLRLPGQINVNTAYPDVLRAIPGIQTASDPDQAVANILAYRDRFPIGSANSANPAAYPRKAATPKIPATDFSTNYGGATSAARGIRSLSELLVPLAVTGAADLQSRDAVWASCYNLCTVRSDTFIVYGYMEAVRVNPAYPASPGHNNGTDWYAGVTDDPHDATKPNLRIAQRRWVALIDRSFSNYDRSDSKFTLPRVVAIKDLPQ
jgi:hypothetical protein